MNQLIQQIRILNLKQLREVNEYIEDIKNAYTDAPLMSEDGSIKCRNDPSTRSNSHFFLSPESGISAVLHLAMEQGLQTYRDRVKKLNPIFGYWPIPGSPETFFGRENIQLLRYLPGQKYVFHHDQADFEKQPEYNRTLSTVLYLNTGFEGGGTEFPHKTFKPKPGYALFFPSNWCYPHSGQEVISGEKRVAVTWWYAIREPELKI